MYALTFAPQALEDLARLKKSEPAAFKKAGKLLGELQEHPKTGGGYGTMRGYVDGDGRPSHGFQITPIGVSYGKRFFGFAELGTGWMFYPVRTGIGYRF